MSRFLTSMLSAGIPFGIVFFVIFILLTHSGIGAAIVTTIMATLVFSLIMASLQAYLLRSPVYPQLASNEQMIRAGLATHGTLFRDAGGWLVLSNQFLHFKSHKLSSKTRQFAFPLNTLRGVTLSTIGWPSHNLIFIQLHTGEIEQFRVEDAAKWQGTILAAIATYQASPHEVRSGAEP